MFVCERKLHFVIVDIAYSLSHGRRRLVFATTVKELLLSNNVTRYRGISISRYTLNIAVTISLRFSGIAHLQ